MYNVISIMLNVVAFTYKHIKKFVYIIQLFHLTYFTIIASSQANYP